MAQAHHRDQRGQLPPYVDLEDAQGGRPAGREGDDDRQADEGHHPRLPITELSAGALQEDPAAVEEDDGAQHGGDPFRTRERWCPVAEPVLDLAAPDHDGDRQQQHDPELALEHLRVVPGVLVVGCVVWRGHDAPLPR